MTGRSERSEKLEYALNSAVRASCARARRPLVRSSARGGARPIAVLSSPPTMRAPGGARGTVRENRSHAGTSLPRARAWRCSTIRERGATPRAEVLPSRFAGRGKSRPAGLWRAAQRSPLRRTPIASAGAARRRFAGLDLSPRHSRSSPLTGCLSPLWLSQVLPRDRLALCADCR